MSKVLNVALVGFPNCGKTTLYNWLTGSKYRTVNYPGSTTEYAVGALQPGLKQYLKLADKNTNVQIIDTPGTYSFNPKSADEEVTYKIVKGTGAISPSMIGLIIDGTQIERQLVLAKALVDSGTPFFVILTMSDLLDKNKITVDIQKLSDMLGGAAVIRYEGLLGKGVDQIVAAIQPKAEYHFNPEQHVTKEADIAWAEKISKAIVINQQEKTSSYRLTQQVDKLLLHPILGYVFFFVSMSLLFASVYWLAQPFMDFIDESFGSMIDWVTTQWPDSLISDFAGNGILAAIGGTVIFVPQIFILFAIIYLLEGSGYLARVATLIDRPMRYFGLGGRSFVPMMSGFACAIPAIIATRNIASKSERRMAQMLIPLLTCSARIPVYSLILGFLFKGENHLYAGLVMASLYLGSLILSALASGVISRFLIKDQEGSPLLMDLPVYRRPRVKLVLMHAVDKSKIFLKNAGPIIFTLSVVLWFMTTFPKVDPEIAEQASRTEVSYTYAAQIGEAIEPVFKPMGLDWRVGFGVIAAFAAREVFVSSLVLVFNAEGEEEDEQEQSLLGRMHEATWPDGAPLFTWGSSLALLIFFMVAMQCIATYAILKKELGSFTLATIQLIGTNLVAYVLAVGVYSIYLFVT